MRNANLDSFVALLEEMGHAFVKAVRYGIRAVATMSWPGLLITCVALALAITIVPLAIFLFIIFMSIKLIVAAIILNGKRRNAQPHHSAEHDGQ